MRKHGGCVNGRNTPEYRVWSGVKSRCLNPRTREWPRYGGRGITLCERWRTSFEAFYEDMGPRPAGTSLDRIDNDGPYAPDNCRWATAKEQRINSSTITRITHAGKTQTLEEWARDLGVRPKTLGWRLRNGWSPAAAVTVARRDSPLQTHLARIDAALAGEEAS